MSRFELVLLKLTRKSLVAVALCLCGSLTPDVVHAQDQPVLKTSRGIALKVRKEYCGERSFYTVKVLKDASGEIGGYVLQPAIRDAPISFLDHEGNILASFHIFGNAEEKRDAMAAVGPLTKRFPVEEGLDCGNGPPSQ